MPSAGASPVGVAPGDEAAAAQNIRGMFGRVAPRYDLLNRLLSGGVDIWWRSKLARSVRDKLADPDARIFDLCCGTGDVALALATQRRKLAGPDARPVLASDFCRPMLLAAHPKLSDDAEHSHLLEADAMSFPVPDGSVDLVTMAFGFRNLANYEGGLEEMVRLLAPGGVLAVLECSQPTNRIWGPAFDWYFRNILPKIGNALSGAGDAYSYLQRSVERFLTPEELAQAMRDAGFAEARFDRLTGGIACLHVARKAPASE